jgi:hypothetical protein
MEMKQAEEKGREESDKEPLLMSSDASGNRLCLSCRLMIFFLHILHNRSYQVYDLRASS